MCRASYWSFSCKGRRGGKCSQNNYLGPPTFAREHPIYIYIYIYQKKRVEVHELSDVPFYCMKYWCVCVFMDSECSITGGDCAMFMDGKCSIT